MGKNGGGKPADTILTLEEALMRFKGQRGEAGAETRVEGGSESNVHHVDFSAAAKREGEGKATGYLDAEDIASVSAQHDEANAEMSASDIVAVIDGIPRTMEELERLAAAEKAYDQDFSRIDAGSCRGRRRRRGDWRRGCDGAREPSWADSRLRVHRDGHRIDGVGRVPDDAGANRQKSHELDGARRRHTGA